MREDVDLLLDARRRRRGRRSTTSCCSAWAARRSRPRCCGRRFGGERFHVLDTTHPAGDPRARRRSSTSSARCSSPRRSRARRSRRARTPTTSGSSRRAASSGSRSPIPARSSSSSRASASSRAIFAGRADDRRPLLGALAVRARAGGAARRRPRGGCSTARCEMAEACRLDEGNPGLELGLALGEGWQAGRDKVCVPERARLRPLGRAAARRVDRQGGQGPRARRPASRPTGPTGRRTRCGCPSPYELGQEFFRWEFATAVAGSILGINPFDQPDVQAAKDRTNEVLAAGDVELEPEGSLDELFAQAAARRLRLHPGVRRPDAGGRGARSRALAERARSATGCVVTHGFGPRYLHSTGQLHKGGPNTGALPAGGRGLRRRSCRSPASRSASARLIRAQAAGDFESLRERGRRVARVHMEEVLADAARDDRPRPHGRQHDDPARAGRARREDLRPRRRRRRPRRSRSCATSSTRRARSG